MGEFMEPGVLPPADLQGLNKSRISVAFEHVKREWTEGLFYFILLVTIIEAGFILWDLLTMMRWFTVAVGLKQANTFTASTDMSNVYLALLGVYSGYKEYARWQGGAPAVSEDEVAWFSRGAKIVFFWLGLLICSVAIKDLHLIARMPNELMRVAMQSLLLWAGTRCSGITHQKRFKKKMNEATADGMDAAAQDAVSLLDEGIKAARRSEAHGEKVLEYLKTNASITNEKCREITGLSINQSYRLLSDLEDRGNLKSEGTARGKKYHLSD
jgi:hypothetical protein